MTNKTKTPTLRTGPFAPRDGVTPRIFLDLMTSVITEDEMRNIAVAPPRVIDHEYGAWVNVTAEEADGSDHLTSEEGWENFPNLRAVLLFARSMGAFWVNLDADGYDTISSLPTFDW